MRLNDAVGKDSNIMSGELCFKGTRVPVANLFGYLSGGSSVQLFLEDFPTVRPEQVKAVLEKSLASIEAAVNLRKSA